MNDVEPAVDILDRLRKAIRHADSYNGPIFSEAAEEIDRLRAELAKLEAALEATGWAIWEE